MKIRILSDLHLEFERFDPPEGLADVVVLAGDIGVGLSGLGWAEESFPDTPVVYVPGNHEFYHQDLGLLQAMRAYAPGEIHVLDNEEVRLGGVRFLGCTLWTDFALHGAHARERALREANLSINDFSIIRDGRAHFTAEDSARRHAASRAFLETRLAEPFAGKTVVVTHHAPAPGSVSPRFEGDPLTPSFVSDLTGLMGAERVALWVHGHTHARFDYQVRGTRVVCNPKGYPGEEWVSEFDPEWGVDL